MSAIPVPKPRAFAQQENKKPIPLPRKLVQQKHESIEMPHPESQNTFSRRMRTLSSTSKQITGEISGKVQETKKAVIESTRQSVRKITRRFSSPHERSNSVDEVDNSNKNDEDSLNSSSDIFNSIRFQSPLTVEPENDAEAKHKEHIYSNCNENESDSDESISLPPPSHPPPPLPDESFYDKPQSISGNVQCPPVAPRLQYEAVFPVYPVFPTSSDSENSGNDSKTGTLDTKTKLQRSGSWSFYDPVTLNEVTYSNMESVEQLNIKKTDDRSSGESSTYSELNTCYENYILELRKRNENNSQKTIRPPTKSTILEFDPLVSNSTLQPNNDIAMLEQILHEDLYGNIQNQNSNYDQWSLTSELETDEYLNPPTPPKRFDSLNDEAKSIPVVHEEKSRTNWFTLDTKPNPVSENKKIGWMKQLNDVLKKVPESARNIRAGLQKEKYLDRPTLNYRAVAHHKGILFKINRKSMEDLFGEFHFRWCILGNGALTFYGDNACDNFKESFTLDSIMSIQLLDKKIKFETEMYCFILNVSGKSGRGRHTFGIGSLIECKQWMQRIAEALTNRFPLNVVVDYKKMGWAYLREGVSGTWAGAWLVVSSRRLYYAKDDAAMCTVDLRKARCIQLQEQDPDTPKTTDKGPNLLVDSQEGTLYLRMWTAKETKMWCHVIQTEAYKNGRRLDEQQLTKDDVPVIVEKCINFIYAHGSMTEGIYRRSGSSSTISDILGQFHQNAWSVTLTVDRCSEHDVANVLKRFLRALPDPILTSESSQYLCQIADSFQNASEKVTLYRAVLEQFCTVPYKTLKRLLGHLHFIQSQRAKNRMSVDNLAAIWGPTLVHHEGPDGEWSPTEANLVVQLISLYRDLFPVSAEELDRERMMLQVLERCHRGAITGQGPAHVKASGDLRVWVHLGEKNGETVNITIGPQKLAADICIELSEKMKIPAYELQLEELVLNDSLRRPVHYSEKVLDVVLRWGYWDEADRKDNCLVLAPMAKYKQFDRPVETSAVLYDEFRFADNKSKTFKFLVFKFAQAKLCYYKDKIGNIKIQEWNIEDILWYFGHEPRHNPQSKWSLTFILRTQPPKRSRAIPFFGYTIGGVDLATRVNWISAMIRAEHSSGLQPPLMNIAAPNG